MNFFRTFKSKVLETLGTSRDQIEDNSQNKSIAFGALLWIIAEADNQFTQDEEKMIETILKKHLNVSQTELPLILESIKKAADERIDLFKFTNAVKDDLSLQERILIVENLFRVACADNDLDDSELETIRKISKLFFISHRDFIEAKIKIKNELGLPTFDNKNSAGSAISKKSLKISSEEEHSS